MPVRLVGRRRVVPIISLALLLVATVVVVARWGPWSGTEVTVRVTGLPDRAHGAVVITGPGGSRTLRTGEVWRTTPGTYAVAIEPVHHGASTFHAADPVAEVTVFEDRANEVLAEYRVEIADHTRIAPQDDSPIVSVTEAEVVLTDGPYARDLRVGHVIASAPTDRVPSAFAAYVAAVQPRADGTVAAAVVHVPLSVAMPKMVVRTEHAPQTRAHQNALAPGGIEDETGMITREIEAMMTSGGDVAGSCASGFASFGYALPRLGLIFNVVDHDIHWSPVDVKVDFHWPPIDVEVRKPRFYVRLALGYELGVKADFQIEGAIECKLESERSLPSGKMCKLISKIPKLGVLGKPGCDWGLRADLAFSAGEKVRIKADSMRRTKRFATVDIPPDREFEMTEPRTTYPLAKGGIDRPADSRRVTKLEVNTKAGPYVMIEWSTGLTPSTEVGLEWDNWFAAGVKAHIGRAAGDKGSAPVKVQGTLGVLYQYEIAMKFNVPDHIPLVEDHYRIKWKPRTVDIPVWEHTFPQDTEIDEGPRREVPEELKLPNEIGPNYLVSTERTEPWRAAEECLYRAHGPTAPPLPSDARRTAFHSVVSGKAWQLGVYPDNIAAQAAFDQIERVIDTCPTGAQSSVIPRPDVGADEAFIKVFQQPATESYGEIVDNYNAYLVTRVVNVIVVAEEEDQGVPTRDPRATDEPLVLEMRNYLVHLCGEGWWCPS